MEKNRGGMSGSSGNRNTARGSIGGFARSKKWNDIEKERVPDSFFLLLSNRFGISRA
jgi:hypothetical protein